MTQNTEKTIALGVIMDPIEHVNPHKDSTLAMLAEASKRGWTCSYFEQHNLFIQEGKAYGKATPIDVTLPEQTTDASHCTDQPYYQLASPHTLALGELDVILMRKDPPFDMNYIYTTHILELAQQQGAQVFNRPQSLRDFNEKLFIAQFPHCCAPTLVTSSQAEIERFRAEHGTLILKPLDGMGGSGIFKVSPDDPNLNVMLSMLTQQAERAGGNQGGTPIMAQRYIPEITQGDKRILLVNGEPIDYALARIPKEGEVRGNLAAGGVGKSQPLSERDRWICDQLAPTLREKGLIFVGIDVIGDYLTEINITSPTCIRELDTHNGITISATLMDAIEQQLH